jgi:hemoglobin
MSEPETSPGRTPFERFGGEGPVRELVERFYDLMDEREPALAALHQREDGKVSRASRDRFALFLIGWLGGPDTYMERHGHPRLRMRHARVPVTSTMRDGWLRCMHEALAERAIPEDLRAFLRQRFAEVADFLRNQPE